MANEYPSIHSGYQIDSAVSIVLATSNWDTLQSVSVGSDGSVNIGSTQLPTSADISDLSSSLTSDIAAVSGTVNVISSAVLDLSQSSVTINGAVGDINISGASNIAVSTAVGSDTTTIIIGQSGLVVDAPVDSNTYVRSSGAWKVIDPYLNTSTGGTVSAAVNFDSGITISGGVSCDIVSATGDVVATDGSSSISLINLASTVDAQFTTISGALAQI